MSAHTPGPWSAVASGRKYDTLRIVSEQGIVADRIVGGGTADDGAANADLIAAAPDLLAALEGMLAEVAFEPREAHGEVCETDPCVMCAARAAIAKARGGGK